MPRKSPYQRVLSDLRARLAWRVEQAKKVVGCRERDLAPLERALARGQAKVEKANEKVRGLEGELAACDLLLRKAISTQAPEAIAPVRDQAGRYGPHGGLGDALRAAFFKRNGAPVSTTELRLEMEAQFGLVFEYPELRKKWRTGPLLGRLHYWVGKGWVEHVGYEQGPNKKTSLWRWIADREPTEADIKVRAFAAGLAVLQEDAPDEDEPT